MLCAPGSGSAGQMQLTCTALAHWFPSDCRRYKPWYLEECSSTLATTYSSGTPGRDKSVATVDMDGQLRPDHLCTSEHTGESTLRLPPGAVPFFSCFSFRLLAFCLLGENSRKCVCHRDVRLRPARGGHLRAGPGGQPLARLARHAAPRGAHVARRAAGARRRMGAQRRQAER